MTQASGFGFWLITPRKVAVEANFKHNRNSLVKPRRMIYFCLAKFKVKVDPEVRVRSHPLRSWIELWGQIAYQSIRKLSASTLVPFSALYLTLIASYQRTMLMTQKLTPVTSSQKCMQK